MKIYRIANWRDQYETSETKKYKTLQWVPSPNKHDGLGYRRMVAQKNRCELFAAWQLLVHVASKSKFEDRGRLVRDGQALTPEDLEIMTGFPAKIFADAYAFFSSKNMGWLVVDNEPTGEADVIAGESAVTTGASDVLTARREENRIEGIEEKRTEDPKGSAQQSDEEFLEGLKKNPAYEGIDVQREFQKMATWCAANRKQPSQRRFINWLNRAEKPMKTSGALHQPQLIRPPTITELRTIMQAKEAQASQLRFKHCTEAALGDTWDNEKARQDYRQLKREIKELNNRIALYAA